MAAISNTSLKTDPYTRLESRKLEPHTRSTNKRSFTRIKNTSDMNKLPEDEQVKPKVQESKQVYAVTKFCKKFWPSL